ncbi:LPXTG cell wall anchor domain-containing protein [Enterococcus sp. DIV1298c]|uniref:LPXTG cell wall anchor domain-containing protein n=1 Tax=Enterococcus sp. DIV1298c TaxID=2815328 RepID=UPI001A924BDE|nr:LPXTG cell wall anchor domain-containing protein [Enterococcus sp. DIV1298c]MBO0460491.1 LPXTG cell wall anchor domain-containing protein [Enterococcus sp. DIV1298c]
MVKLSKKKLIANILLSSMLLAQTVPTFANALENDEMVSQTESGSGVPGEATAQEEATDRLEDQFSLSEEFDETNGMAIEPLFSGGGNGSIDSPFQITTEAQLNEMRNDLTAHYQLMNDITLTSDWIPVGYGATSATKFTGSFIATPGTVIRNMRVTTGVQSGDEDNRGFFGVTEGARISGVTLENPLVIGGGSGGATGGLIGRISDVTRPTTVADSAIIGGSIETSSTYVGGLVGFIPINTYGTAVIRSSSSATVTVNGDVNDTNQAVGGLIGYNGNTVVDSYATGHVTANVHNVGGLIGYNHYGHVSRSYATGNVTSSGGEGHGGLIGTQFTSSTVVDSYATGDVTGINKVGGFIGEIQALAKEVARSYSTGHVVGIDFVGGFVGKSSQYRPKNSYAMGDVIGETNVHHFNLENYSIRSYYYNNSKVLAGGERVEGKITPDVLEPLDVIELRTQSTYKSNGWDFGSTWIWDTTTNYPKLGIGNEVDTLPIDALGETIEVPYGGRETKVLLSDAFSVFGRGGNPADYLFGTDADGFRLSDDGQYLILEVTSIGTYEITATPLRRLTVLEPGQHWNKATVEVTPAEITLEKGTVFARSFNGTTDIDRFDAPTLTGLAPGDEATWIEGDFKYKDSVAGTNTIEGANWTLDWGTIDLSNYDVTSLPTNGEDTYLIEDLFEVEAITKAAGAYLRIDEELAAQNNTHEVITIAGTALLHHDDTPDTPGEHWYHDHAEELLQDVTFLIYDTDPQANPLARVVAYADGIAAVDGAFVGLSPNTSYWITAISDESTNFSAGEESDPIVLTTARSGGNGGNGGNGGPGGNTGNNTGDPSGNNSPGNNQPGTTPNGGSGNGSGTNAAATSTGRGGKLPNTGEVVSAFALLGFGAVGTALASWLKRKKDNETMV